MVWTNSTVEVYHGTIERYANNIVSSGPDPKRGRFDTDFGPGFYITSSLHQARQWANIKARARPTEIPAVVIFDLDLDEIAQYKDHLVFTLDDTRFHDFVTFNRLGGRHHSRISAKSYDVIYGPLSAYPQSVVYKDCAQICFSASTVVNLKLTLLTPRIVTPTSTTYF